MPQMRLDKFLGEMGTGSRSQIKEMAKKGRIQVNGQTEKKSDRKIDPENDQVWVDGQEVLYVPVEYYMLNKPAGVVSATEDSRFPTVISLLADAVRKDLFPVGRLDMDTEGLLLLTNDGDLAHRLLSPKKHVDKVYYAELEGRLPADSQKRVEEGLILADGTKTLPAKLEILHQAKSAPGRPEETEGIAKLEKGTAQQVSGCTRIRLTIHEGKFHQVKRMMEVLGCHVVYLKRLSMGTLFLDKSLKPGEYRKLTDEEVQALRKAGG